MSKRKMDDRDRYTEMGGEKQREKKEISKQNERIGRREARRGRMIRGCADGEKKGKIVNGK